MKNLKILLICAGATGLMWQSAHAQTEPLSPRQIDRSVIRPGARAQGLGGTTLFGSGIAAAATNPAAISQSRGFGLGADVVGRTDNVKVGDITDLIDGVNDLNDAANSGEFPLGAFDDVFQFANNNSNRPLRASATPSLGLTFSNLGQNRLSAGVLAYGEAIADVRAVASGTGNARTLNARGAVLSLSAIAVPVAVRLGVLRDRGTLGANLKIMRADYQPASFLADETSRTIIGTSFDRANSSKFGLDIGYISPSLLPTLPGRPYDLQAAFAIRNLISPSFDLRARGRQNDLVNGGTVPVTFNGSFKQSPQFDAGLRLSAPLARTTGYLEVHNLTGKNGGDRSFHVGAEFAASRNFLLRGGYDDDQFTAGLGLNLGGARVDLAVGQKPSERFALGISLGQ